MNEEWRIAAECAVQSGGVPVTFVTCAGGRLTVRELTKCLTGEFGKDCFGPNNTIVKYYAGTFNDMRNLLGGRWSEFENNDAVKTGKALINFAEDSGKAVEKTFNDAQKIFGREVNAEKVREWVDDPVGSYQRGDVGREVNPDKVNGWVQKPGESVERSDLNPGNWF